AGAFAVAAIASAAGTRWALIGPGLAIVACAAALTVRAAADDRGAEPAGPRGPAAGPPPESGPMGLT
ncbi:MAG: hypothetical protein ACRDOA_04810, partial [Streptosporangiaceae bacterium]